MTHFEQRVMKFMWISFKKMISIVKHADIMCKNICVHWYFFRREGGQLIAADSCLTKNLWTKISSGSLETWQVRVRCEQCFVEPDWRLTFSLSAWIRERKSIDHTSMKKTIHQRTFECRVTTIPGPCSSLFIMSFKDGPSKLIVDCPPKLLGRWTRKIWIAG